MLPVCSGLNDSQQWSLKGYISISTNRKMTVCCWWPPTKHCSNHTALVSPWPSWKETCNCLPHWELVRRRERLSKWKTDWSRDIIQDLLSCKKPISCRMSIKWKEKWSARKGYKGIITAADKSNDYNIFPWNLTGFHSIKVKECLCNLLRWSTLMTSM